MTAAKENVPQYNRAKPWQLILFTLNDVAFNVYYFGIAFLSYYATGVVGLGVVFVSYLLTVMRVFDGITDPMIGILLDRTNTRFGKFRPFMVGGNLIMAISVVLMFGTTHMIPEGILRTIYFILIYAVYIIGYTCQGAATRAGQSCLTTDPKQRPMVSVVSGTGCGIIATIIQMIVSGYLMVKHGGEMGTPFFIDLICILIPLSAVLTILAVIGIWEKDCPKYYGLGEKKGVKKEKIRLKDYWQVIKGNRALQMLILAASTDKLASTVSGNAIVSIMIFGIICGNYALSGEISMITIVPTMVLLLVGALFAGKMGQRKAVVVFSALSIVSCLGIVALFVFGDPSQISMSNMGFTTIAFLVLYILMRGFMGIPGSLVIPMIADCSDYEIYRSGKYVPGLMGTLFSFVDKTISAFGNTIVGLMIAAIGYTTVQPTVNDPLTTPVFTLALVLWCGLPILGWICSIIGMKFSPLTREKMVEVQAQITEIKAQNEAEGV